MKNIFSNWRSDAPASLVVFLVALPLCLGVALASTGENPVLFSGIIAGVVGGVVVGFSNATANGTGVSRSLRAGSRIDPQIDAAIRAKYNIHFR